MILNLLSHPMANASRFAQNAMAEVFM